MKRVDVPCCPVLVIQFNILRGTFALGTGLVTSTFAIRLRGTAEVILCVVDTFCELLDTFGVAAVGGENALFLHCTFGLAEGIDTLVPGTPFSGGTKVTLCLVFGKAFCGVPRTFGVAAGGLEKTLLVLICTFELVSGLVISTSTDRF